MDQICIHVRTDVRKTNAEEKAEKFLERCKSGKPRLQPKQKLQQRLRQSVADVVRGHKQRRETQKICSGHHFFYIALRVCHENNIENAPSIADIITEIFLCERNLQAIFSILLPGHMMKSNVNINIPTIYPGFSTKNIKQCTLDAFKFYLHNVCEVNSNAVQIFEKRRLINCEFDPQRDYIPITAAARRRDPLLVLLLLRYGSNPCQVVDTDSSMNAIDIISSGLNSIYTFKTSTLGNHAKETMTEEEEKGKLCLRYIFRAVQDIPFSQTSYFDTQGTVNESDKKRKTYNLHPKLASTLDVSKFSRVRSLQHLCRLTIRKQILNNSPRCLPVSIQLLPVTKVMKNYLDLQFD